MKRFLSILLWASVYALLFQVYGYGQVVVPAGTSVNITASGSNIPGTGPYSPSSFTANAVLTGNGSGPIQASALSFSGNTLSYGTPSYADTGVATQFTASFAGYWQHILQNTSNATNASADIIVGNDQNTATTHYGDFGINSSTFTGTGSLALAGATYLYSQTGDLVLATNTSNAIHLVVNNGAADSMTISSGGTVSLPAQTTNGVVVTTGGAGALSSTVTPAGLTSVGTNAVASAAGNNLTLTGPSGQGIIFQSAGGTVADLGVTVAGQFTNTSNAASTGLAHQVASGNTAGLRLGQTGVTNWNILNTSTTGVLSFGNATVRFSLDTSGNALFSSKITSYNGITTAGNGVPVIVAQANITAQSGAATITSYANPAADADFEISCQANVSAATSLSAPFQCTYTDVNNVAKTLTFAVQDVDGTGGTYLVNGLMVAAAAKTFMTPVMHIRVKASTTITLKTGTGTYTGVTYSASGVIKKTD